MRRTTISGSAGLTGLALAMLLGLTGCADQPEGADTTTAPTGSDATAPPSQPDATTQPPQPVTTPGPCPYLDQGYVEETIGQMVSSVEVTTTQPPVTPLPKCTFYALNDEAALIVTTEQHPSPIEAMNAALAKVGDAANPVTNAGDGGAVLTADGQTTCAISAGTAVIVIRINEESSLAGEEVAATVAAQVP